MQTYQLKLSIDGSLPTIWRELKVRSTMSLHSLHEAILVVMEWHGFHAYEFDHAGMLYRNPQDGGKHVKSLQSSHRYSVGNLIDKQGQVLRYRYDFADNWRVTIILEAILPIEESVVPKCSGGELAPPFDDCGGIEEYSHILELLSKKQGKEYFELKEWLKEMQLEDFDPNSLDLEEINWELEHKHFSYLGDEKPVPLTAGQEKRVAQILSKVQKFSLELLNQEYAIVCEKLMVDMVNAGRGYFIKGNPDNWAAAVVVVVGGLNFLGDPSSALYMELSVIMDYFEVSPKRVMEKSQSICEEMNLTPFEGEYILPSVRNSESYTRFMEMIDGVEPLDIEEDIIS
ncbi:MAG: IS1096 element passenger TnpR family protein [Bacteroidales bacterium]